MIRKHRHLLKVMPWTAALLGALVAQGCGKANKDDSSAATTSPSTTGGVNAGQLLVTDVAPSIVLAVPVGTLATSSNLTDDNSTDLDSEDPRKVRAEAAKLADATTVEQCLVGIEHKVGQRNADCYGPSVWVSDHHPDGTWQDGSDKSLPSGDLGFWEEKEQATGEACAASKMNNLIGGVRENADTGLQMTLRAGCLARVLGKALPTVKGEALDLAEAANTALGNHIDKLKFSKMTIKFVDTATYETEVEATDPRGDVWTRVTLKRTSDTESEGYVWGIFTPTANAANPGNGSPAPLADAAKHHAFSVLFKESGTSMTYDATQSKVEDAEIASDKAAVFEADKRVRVATTGNPGYDHVMTTMDTTALTGETVYLWTAGFASEEQRVMHIKVSASGDTRTGVGYFGFGAKLSDFRTLVKSGTVPATATSIEKMICNWAGPGNSHTGTANVQKQTLSFNATTGYFDPVASHIGYAARVDCGSSADDAAFTWSPKKTATRPADSDFKPWPKFELSDFDAEKAELTLPSLFSSSL